MNVWDALKKTIHDTGMSYTSVEKVICRGKNYIAGNMSRKSCPSYDNALLMFRACGYTLCIVRQGDEPEGAIMVDETLPEANLSAEERSKRVSEERERRRKALLQGSMIWIRNDPLRRVLSFRRYDMNKVLILINEELDDLRAARDACIDRSQRTTRNLLNRLSEDEAMGSLKPMQVICHADSIKADWDMLVGIDDAIAALERVKKEAYDRGWDA